MAYEWSMRKRRAQAAACKPGVAASVAEALMGHDHRCFARLAAEHFLEMLGIDETTFLQRWQEGFYDA
jgi:hypothetical protein